MYPTRSGDRHDSPQRPELSTRSPTDELKFDISLRRPCEFSDECGQDLLAI